MYISRQLSFASATQYQEIVDLTAQQTQMYDAACTFWAELFGCFQHALAVLNVKELNKRVTARNRGLAPEERGATPNPNPNPNPSPNPNPNPNPNQARAARARPSARSSACSSSPRWPARSRASSNASCRPTPSS